MIDSDWKNKGACLGANTDVFFPKGGRGAWAAPALAICHTCPVQTECLLANIYETVGVFGGLTQDQRQRMRVLLGLRRSTKAA